MTPSSSPLSPPDGFSGVTGVWESPEPLPDGVSLSVDASSVDEPDVSLPLTYTAFLSVASRLSDFALRSPVARARSFTVSTFLATLNSLSLSAPPFLFLMPREKMARSSIFTFLPPSSSSLIHVTMSVRIPLMAPLE